VQLPTETSAEVAEEISATSTEASASHHRNFSRVRLTQSNIIDSCVDENYIYFRTIKTIYLNIRQFLLCKQKKFSYDCRKIL
jgi:hypothetical protein